MASMLVVHGLVLTVGLNSTGTGCFSGDSWKVLFPRSLSLCSVKPGLIVTHFLLWTEVLQHRLSTDQTLLHLTGPASPIKALSVRGFPPTLRPDPGAQGLLNSRTILPDEILDDPTIYAPPLLELAGRSAFYGEGISAALAFSPFTNSPLSIPDNHLRFIFITPRLAWLDDDELSASNDWAMLSLRLISINTLASVSKHNAVKEVLNHGLVISFGFASVLNISGGITGVYYPCFMSYLSFMKNLLVDSPGLVLYPLGSISHALHFSCSKSNRSLHLPVGSPGSSSSLSSLSSFLRSLFPPILWRCPSISITGLLSCGAVRSGPEDATGFVSTNFRGADWMSTSQFKVTISLLSDHVVKATLTHSSTVLSSLSFSSFEDLSLLSYVVVVYAFKQKGWIIPSSICIQII